MNTNERKPLLSDWDRDSNVPYKGAGYSDAWRWGFDYARRGYEDLITTGKLRVVEEVEGMIIPFTNVAGVVHSRVVCSSCEANIAPYGIGNPNNYFNYCPGCGNKIKR